MRPPRPARLAAVALGVALSCGASAQPVDAGATPVAGVSAAELGRALQVGDLVFIRVGAYPFRKVSEATGSWANHVGIVLDVSGSSPIVGESRFPFAGSTSLARFVARSAGGQVAVMRLPAPLTAGQQAALAEAARRRAGARYDTGFDLHSRGQFCSRYVRELLQAAAGVEVGRVETFRDLLARAPATDLAFWRVWYFGVIPWQRETVTPASVLRSPGLTPVFDGVAG